MDIFAKKGQNINKNICHSSIFPRFYKDTQLTKQNKTLKNGWLCEMILSFWGQKAYFQG